MKRLSSMQYTTQVLVKNVQDFDRAEQWIEQNAKELQAEVVEMYRHGSPPDGRIRAVLRGTRKARDEVVTLDYLRLFDLPA